MFKLQMLFDFQKLVTHYCQWHHSDVLINSNLYCSEIITKLSFFQSNYQLPNGPIFQQESAPAYTACSAQNELRANSPDFTTKDQWPPNLSNINPMDNRVWDAMLEAYCKLKTKPRTIALVKKVLQVIWGHLP